KIGLIHSVRRAVSESTQVLMGSGTYNTAKSVELSKRAADAGADGLVAVTPYYSKPEQRGLVGHFTAIADATDVPVMLYNIPGRTGRLIEVSTLVELAGHDNIVAVKDAVMDIDHTSDTVSRAHGLAVYSGQDSYTMPMMAVGAVGVVSVVSHLAGRQVAAMVDAMHAGNLAEARRLHHLLLPLCASLFVESNPAPVKAAMSRYWSPVGAPRPPLAQALDSTVDGVGAALVALQDATA
ncbi:MAG: 4-hydroxy-tetrahydrodipicolinate synthase, partial [Acidimicrobiia bacterium]|nr:4-hydroxy-tetrahydrodipicolinate synthase [Acidimicrobiia bacterium]